MNGFVNDEYLIGYNDYLMRLAALQIPWNNEQNICDSLTDIQMNDIEHVCTWCEEINCLKNNEVFKHRVLSKYDIISLNQAQVRLTW